MSVSTERSKRKRLNDALLTILDETIELSETIPDKKINRYISYLNESDLEPIDKRRYLGRILLRLATDLL